MALSTLENERDALERATRKLADALVALGDALGGSLTGQALTDATQAQTKAQSAYNNARKAAQRVLVEQLTVREAAATAEKDAAQSDLNNLP